MDVNPFTGVRARRNFLWNLKQRSFEVDGVIIGHSALVFKNTETVRAGKGASPPYLYPGEPPIKVMRRLKPGPFETRYLRDPDGNYVDLSESGWPS